MGSPPSSPNKIRGKGEKILGANGQASHKQLQAGEDKKDKKRNKK